MNTPTERGWTYADFARHAFLKRSTFYAFSQEGKTTRVKNTEILVPLDRQVVFIEDRLSVSVLGENSTFVFPPHHKHPYITLAGPHQRFEGFRIIILHEDEATLHAARNEGCPAVRLHHVSSRFQNTSTYHILQSVWEERDKDNLDVKYLAQLLKSHQLHEGEIIQQGRTITLKGGAYLLSHTLHLTFPDVTIRSDPHEQANLLFLLQGHEDAPLVSLRADLQSLQGLILTRIHSDTKRATLGFHQEISGDSYGGSVTGCHFSSLSWNDFEVQYAHSYAKWRDRQGLRVLTPAPQELERVEAPLPFDDSLPPTQNLGGYGTSRIEPRIAEVLAHTKMQEVNEQVADTHASTPEDTASTPPQEETRPHTPLRFMSVQKEVTHPMTPEQDESTQKVVTALLTRVERGLFAGYDILSNMEDTMNTRSSNTKYEAQNIDPKLQLEMQVVFAIQAALPVPPVQPPMSLSTSALTYLALHNPALLALVESLCEGGRLEVHLRDQIPDPIEDLLPHCQTTSGVLSAVGSRKWNPPREEIITQSRPIHGGVPQEENNTEGSDIDFPSPIFGLHDAPSPHEDVVLRYTTDKEGTALPSRIRLAYASTKEVIGFVHQMHLHVTATPNKHPFVVFSQFARDKEGSLIRDFDGSFMKTYHCARLVDILHLMPPQIPIHISREENEEPPSPPTQPPPATSSEVNTGKSTSLRASVEYASQKEASARGVVTSWIVLLLLLFALVFGGARVCEEYRTTLQPLQDTPLPFQR